MDEELVAPEVLDELEELFELLSELSVSFGITVSWPDVSSIANSTSARLSMSLPLSLPHQIIQIIAKPCHLFAMESAPGHQHARLSVSK